MGRLRCLRVLLVMVLVGGSVPAWAEDGVVPAADEIEADDGDGSLPGLRVVVPEVPDLVVASEPLPGFPALPDADAGRDGFVHGVSVVTVDEGGRAEFGELPVRVEVSAGVEGTKPDERVSVGVVVADPAWMAQLSPVVGLGVQVDLFVEGAREDVGERSASVTLDYSGVAVGGGAGLFERLTVLWVDECGALLDGVLVCGKQVPVETRLDPRARTLSFEVTDRDLREPGVVVERGSVALPAGLSGGPRRVLGYGQFGGPPTGGWYVVGSAPDGPQGSFSATPLSPVADYQVGLFTGSLQVSYPLGVAPAFHGPEPSVVLSYDSGSVDGLSGDRNTQAGAVGLGWSWHPGSITRVLAPCKAVVSGWQSGDRCPTPGGEIFYLSLGGVSSRLVEVDAANRIFRLEGEQFWELQLLSGASNDDSEGEWWRLRTPDGTTYQFGREQVASYNSVQWTRVWVPGGQNPNVWCGDQVGVFCNKAYQWNLERVTDRDGFFMEISYDEYTNWYFSAFTSLRQYTRDAQPRLIEYGAGPGGKPHHARVEFGYEDRCLYGNPCDPDEPQDYPDVPYDLVCTPGVWCGQNGPSFWSDRRLTEVDVSVFDFDTEGWVLMDRWVLTHGFPQIPDDPDGDRGLTKLWLIGIQRLGVSAWPGDESAVNALPTWFELVLLPNRLQYVGTQSPVAPQYMPRINRIVNGAYVSGGQVVAEHGVSEFVYGRSHDCARQGNGYDPVIGLDDWPGDDAGNDIPSSWVPTNRRRPCDDFHRVDPSDGGGVALFRKWKVLQVKRLGEWGSEHETITYDWRLDDAQGNPTQTPMWRYQPHDYLGGSSSYWNDYRGNRRVKVTDASGASTIYTFYQGMAGDHQPTQSPALVETFTTSDSVSHTDHEYLVGQVAEVASYDGSTMLTRTTTSYYAAETFSGKGTFFVRPSEVTHTVFGTPDVTATTEWTYDTAHGNPTLVLYNGTAGDSPVLEETMWIQSASYPLMWVPKQRRLWDGDTVGSAGDEAAVVRYFYDGATSMNTAPTAGRLTKTRFYTRRTPSDQYVETLVGYDATMGWPTTFTDPSGTVTAITYDAGYGSVVSRTVDSGGTLALTTTFMVHPRGLLLSSTDPNGQSDLFTYDQFGRLRKYWNRSRPTGQSASLLVTYVNPGDGTPARVKEGSLIGGSRVDVFTYYDGFGRLVQTQVPFDEDGDGTADDRAVTTTRFDNRGLVRVVSNPWVDTTGGAGSGWIATNFNNVDSYTRTLYDTLGRVTATQAMSQGSVLFSSTVAYGTAANRTTTTSTDAEGRWVTHYQDGFGRLVRVAEPGSIDTFYTYTPRGELATVTDDAANTTTMSYDLLGRKTAMSDPDMGVWSYGYDLSSRLVSQTDGRGVTLSFSYDVLGRMTQRAQGSTVLAEWFYGTTTTGNTKGRLVKSRINGNDTDAVNLYVAYDPDGNLLSQDVTIAGVTYDLDYTYFNGGAPKNTVYPLVAGSRETVATSYDGLGRPYDLIGAQTYVAAASWTPAGQPSVWALGAGSDVTRRWDYDSATLRVSQYKAGTSQIAGTATVNLQRLEYSYDDSGNVTRIRDYRNQSQYQCFGYDTHDRLTRAFTADSGCTSYASTGYGPFDHDYTYDSLHNLTSLDGPAYTYGTGNQPGSGDAGPHAVTAVGSISFGYDDNGNRVSKTVGGSTTSYTYDPQNRLVAVDLPGDPDGVVFVYDADGRRVSRSHGDHSTVYVGGVFEIDRDGSTVTDTRTHYRFGDTMVATRTHSPASVVFLLQDHLGSTTAAFDDTSNTAMFQWYFPYGAERHAVGSLPTEQRFTGQTSDATGAASGDTGLLFYNARYYDPDVGAFVAADPIVPTTDRSVGLNRYAYVADNPINYTDPSGHNPLAVCAASTAGGPAVAVACGGVLILFMLGAKAMRDAEPLDIRLPPFRLGGVSDELLERTRRLQAEASATGSKEQAIGVNKPALIGATLVPILLPLDPVDQILILQARPARRSADPEAEGPHSVLDRYADGRTRGYTTYRPNPRKPGEWEVECRLCPETAKPHYDKPSGSEVPGPHVHRPGGSTKPATPGEIPGVPR